MFEMDQVCTVVVSNSHITYLFPRMLCPYLIGQHTFPKNIYFPIIFQLPNYSYCILGNRQEEGYPSGETGGFVSIKETSRTL